MATNTFHDVLNMIQLSGLNYKMEVLPFSAKIHLKNSALKDQNGNQINIPPDIHVSQTKEEKINHARDVLQLENTNKGTHVQCKE